jgi:hypothetical protein
LDHFSCDYKKKKKKREENEKVKAKELNGNQRANQDLFSSK